MDAGQRRVLQRDGGDVQAVAGHHVDDALGQAGRLQQLHQQVRGELLGRRGLPQHHVAHQRRRGRQVAGDGGEVERGDRVDEALQRAVVAAVPHAVRGDRLLGHDLAGEVHVEAQEVDQLAGSVDLGLLRGLGLAEHGGGGQGLAPGAGQQVGGAQEDRGAGVEGERLPGRGRGQGSVDGLLRVRPGGVAQGSEPRRVVVRLDDVELGAAAHAALTVDRHGQLDRLLAAQLLQLRLQAGPFRAAGGVAVDRLVHRRGDLGHSIHERTLSFVPCGMPARIARRPHDERYSCIRARLIGRTAKIIRTALSDRMKDSDESHPSATHRPLRTHLRPTPDPLPPHPGPTPASLTTRHRSPPRLPRRPPPPHPSDTPEEAR